MAAGSCTVGVGRPPAGASDRVERPVTTGWHRFEQAMGLDLRALALLRMALGLLVALDALLRLRSAGALLGGDGVLPLPAWVAAHEGVLRARWSLHLAFGGSTAWVVVLLACQVAAGLALACGWRTRAWALAAWLLVVSVQNRNPDVLNAGDALLRCLLFLGVFLPWAARASVDQALATDAVVAPGRRNDRYLGVPAIALMLQVTAVYVTAALLKNDPAWTVEHSAVRSALLLDFMTRAPGRWLGGAPPGVLEFLTLAVRLMEAFVPVLLWIPWRVGAVRTLVVATMVLLHLALGLAFDLGLLSWVAIAAWLAFLPPALLDRLFAHWRRDRRRRALVLWFDADCGFCQKAALLLRTFLLLPETALRPSDEDPRIAARMEAEGSWVVETDDGRSLVAFDGVLEVLRRSPWAFPLAWVAAWRPVHALGTYLYFAVARRRGFWGRVTSPLRYGERGLRPTRWVGPRDLPLFLFVVYVIVWNLAVLDVHGAMPGRSVPGRVAAAAARVVAVDGPLGPWPRGLGEALRWGQGWTMFAPRPTAMRGWHEARGVLADGREVDLWGALVLGEGVEAARGVRPAVARDLYPTARWRKLCMKALGSPRLAADLGRWFARAWDAGGAGRSTPLVEVRLLFHPEAVLPDGSVRVLEPRVLWQGGP
jgi:hypothetical protein